MGRFACVVAASVALVIAGCDAPDHVLRDEATPVARLIPPPGEDLCDPPCTPPDLCNASGRCERAIMAGCWLAPDRDAEGNCPPHTYCVGGTYCAKFRCSYNLDCYRLGSEQGVCCTTEGYCEPVGQSCMDGSEPPQGKPRPR